MQRGVALNALSLKLGAIASVLHAFALGWIGPVDAAVIGAAAVLLAALAEARWRGQPLRLAPDPLLVGAGLLDGLATLAFFAGLARLGPVPLALLGALSPVFAALLAWMVLGERLARRDLLAGGLAVAGALLFSWRGGAAPDAGGLALAAGSMLGYAGSNLLATLALRRRAALEVLAGSKVWSLLACAAAGLGSGRLFAAPLDRTGVALVVAGALVGGFLSLRLFLEALRHDGLAVSSVVRAAGPVATAAAAWPFFPLALSPVNLAGGAVLLAAVAWLGVRGPRRAA